MMADFRDAIVDRNTQRLVRWLVGMTVLLAVLFATALWYGAAVYHRLAVREAAVQVEGWR